MHADEIPGKKVLFVTRWYPHAADPQLGVFVQKHARAAARNQHVSVLSIWPDTSLQQAFRLDEQVVQGVAEYHLYYRPFRSGLRVMDRFFNLLYYFLYYHLARRVIFQKEGRPDILHGVIFGRSVAAVRWTSILKGIPYVVSEHWSGYATGEFVKRSTAWKAMVRRQCRSASIVTAPSSYLLDHMRTCGLRGTMQVLPNVVDIPEKLPEDPAGGNVINILVVADLVDAVKNISGILRVFSKLPSDPSLTLQIVGDGKDRHALEIIAGTISTAQKQVKFYGRQDNEAVYRFLSGCSFLVMNSFSETFSVVCAEALACGKPVVATRCGGPESFLDPGNSITVEPGNDAQLEQAMLQMIKSFSSYNPGQLRQSVRAFRPETVADALQTLYAQVKAGNTG